jgi:hypothetical protein
VRDSQPVAAMATTTTEDMEKKLQAEPVVSPVDEPEKTARPSGIFATIRYYEEYLDRKMGIESHSLDRVHPENRNSPSAVVMGLMWASATMNISCFSTGFLGNEFGLSLGQTIPIVIFATLLGAAVTVSKPFPKFGFFIELPKYRNATCALDVD